MARSLNRNIGSNLLRRAHSANMQGMGLSKIARINHLHYPTLADKLAEYREMYGLLTAPVSYGKLGEAAERSAPADSTMKTGIDSCFRKESCIE